MAEELVNHVLELLAPLGRARSRRMFGGQGFYVDDLFIALIADGRLYLKVDAQNRPAFEAAGCEPFAYQRAGGERAVMSYFSAPDDAMESPALMQPWARLALAAAVRARAAQPSRPRASRSSAPAAKKTSARPKR
jgi:DNA transformation protein